MNWLNGLRYYGITWTINTTVLQISKPFILWISIELLTFASGWLIHKDYEQGFIITVGIKWSSMVYWETAKAFLVFVCCIMQRDQRTLNIRWGNYTISKRVFLRLNFTLEMPPYCAILSYVIRIRPYGRMSDCYDLRDGT